MRLPRLLGYSRNAVELTIWLAVAVHLLVLLAAHALGWGRRRPTLLAQLAWAVGQIIAADLLPAPARAVQLPLPGRAPNPRGPT